LLFLFESLTSTIQADPKALNINHSLRGMDGRMNKRTNGS
jgi:hypothetical protein